MVKQQEEEKANGGNRRRGVFYDEGRILDERCDLDRTTVERLIQFEVYSDGHRAATFQLTHFSSIF